ncbi:leucine zipper domain-containing protein [Streptomyces sp. NPDC005078]|uniref:helix-turn-helix domain-containing protein n=1 Tax=unclassified Streptomyces TaxID=2593676 RepID=UPI0033B877ED
MLLACCVSSGLEHTWAVAHAVAQMNTSRAKCYQWVRRFAAQGDAGLPDRSGRPRATPLRAPRSALRPRSRPGYV